MGMDRNFRVAKVRMSDNGQLVALLSNANVCVSTGLPYMHLEE